VLKVADLTMGGLHATDVALRLNGRDVEADPDATAASDRSGSRPGSMVRAKN